MAGEREQAQVVAADAQHTGFQHLGGQHHLGTAHPVADHAVEVFRHAVALLVQQPRGLGQGADGHVLEGLVAQRMVGVMVGNQHLDHRLGGDAGDGLAHGFAVAPRRPGVDHHHASLGDNEGGVDDIAAIGLGKIVGAAFEQPGVVGDQPGLEGVVEVRQGGQAQAQA